MKSITIAYALGVLAMANWATGQEAGALPERGTVPPSKRTCPDAAPHAIHVVPPTYPAAARDAGVEGSVLVRMTIDIDGSVRSARVIESIAGLDEAALSCVKKWRFTPARKNGKPVPMVADAPVLFRLKERSSQRQ